MDSRLSATHNFFLYWCGISADIFSYALSLDALLPPPITTSSLLLDAAKMYLYPCRWMLKYHVGLMKSSFTKQLIPSFTLAFNFFSLLCYEKLAVSQTSENSAGFSNAKLHCYSFTGFKVNTPDLPAFSESRVEAIVLHVFHIKCLRYSITKAVF